MTTLDPARDGTSTRTARPVTIDLTAVEAQQRPQQRPRADETDAHLLRLCLDLQLDALLLTLGAVAAEQQRHDDGQVADAVPWRRWVAEDVDLAATLAADAMAGRASLPPTLGSELDHQVPATVVDDLEARYASMRALLTDLLHRDTGRTDDTWRPRVRDALNRCGSRLVELRAHRLAATPPQGVRLPALSGSPLAPEHEYLPGELLG